MGHFQRAAIRLRDSKPFYEHLVFKKKQKNTSNLHTDHWSGAIKFPKELTKISDPVLAEYQRFSITEAYVDNILHGNFRDFNATSKKIFCRLERNKLVLKYDK